MDKRQPVAFMSYVRFDDKHEDGRLSDFRARLSAEVRLQTGEDFPIFQDREDIKWGQHWKERLSESLDEVTFLIPIITPSFFKSKHCREELERFIEREKEVNRNDLILPVYYVTCPLMDDETKRENDKLARIIASRHFADLRELRFEPFTSPQVYKTLADMAAQIREALERVQAAQNAVSPKPTLLRQRQRVSEPSVIIVDQMHRGNYASITEAIKAANPGDRIIVRPGFYKEELVIDKPMEIIGDGDLAEIVIQAEGNDTLLFKTTRGRIANLTLRHTGSGEYRCVNITQGRLELEGCDITSQSERCVSIHSGADPRLRRNRIHDGKGAGIVVRDNGQGVLEDNDIFGNLGEFGGVLIATGGNPVLRRNRIHDNKECGVLVCENGQGMLEDNDIFGNAFSGVQINTGGNPILRKNQIHDNKECGVTVGDNGQGTLEDNDIFGNLGEVGGVLIATGGNPTLRKNRIHDNKACGVGVGENGQGTLEDNDIFGNLGEPGGVGIATGGNPVLRRNRIHDNKECGVLVCENGQGMLEDNDIFGNAFSGVQINTGGNPILRKNQIHDNKECGVTVGDNGQGTLEDNDIFGNALSGVIITTGGNPTLRKNRIYDNKEAGIIVSNNGQGTLKENGISGNARSGVEITTGGNPTLCRNRINKNGQKAIYIHDAGGGTIEDNDLRNNAQGAWEISGDSRPKVTCTRNLE